MFSDMMLLTGLPQDPIRSNRLAGLSVMLLHTYSQESNQFTDVGFQLEQPNNITR